MFLFCIRTLLYTYLCWADCYWMSQVNKSRPCRLIISFAYVLQTICKRACMFSSISQSSSDMKCGRSVFASTIFDCSDENIPFRLFPLLLVSIWNSKGNSGIDAMNSAVAENMISSMKEFCMKNAISVVLNALKLFYFIFCSQARAPHRSKMVHCNAFWCILIINSKQVRTLKRLLNQLVDTHIN